MKTSKMKRGSLIKHLLENVKKESLQLISKELREVFRKKSGIYALYRGDRLVYVGLTTNLYWRVQGHTKSKRLIWDNFSIFIVKNLKYLRDLETGIVRIARPKGNRIEGRVPDHHFLKRILKFKVKQKRSILKKRARFKDNEMKSLKKEIEQLEEAI